MKPLPMIQRVLTWVSVLPAHENTSRWDKLAYLTFSATFMAVLLASGASSIAFILKHISFDIEQASYAMATSMAIFSALYMFIISYFARSKLKAMLNNLATIYEYCKNFLGI